MRCLGIDRIERRWIGECGELGHGFGFGVRGERRVRVRIEPGGDGSPRGDTKFPFLCPSLAPLHTLFH